jgi:hypothetical protein
VVEGDLAKQVLELKQTGRTAKELVFSLITSIDIVTRCAFAKTFRDLCSRNQRMMHVAEGVFAENQSVVDKYPFEVLCLALLKTGRALRLSKDPLSQLEELLGKKAPFLSQQ